MPVNRAQAACRGARTEIFYSEWTLDQARELCDGCSQRAACLDAELVYEAGMGPDKRAGVYGGFTAAQRYALEQRGDSLRCWCGELRDPLDVRAGRLVCAHCDRKGATAPIPDDGEKVAH